MKSFLDRVLKALIFVTFLPSAAEASEVPGFYQHIADNERVPADIWFALLKQESCISLKSELHCLPWPWTLNIDNKPYRLRTKDQAVVLLKMAIANGSPVAIGLGQIYWPAHYDQFDSPEQLLDIGTNLSYSASWLRKQYERSGDWWEAVGRYHAPNKPIAAEGYRKKVYKRWELL